MWDVEPGGLKYSQDRRGGRQLRALAGLPLQRVEFSSGTHM